ncbi:Gp88 [Mycolicibacterium brisbanense]|uniref:Gp88 n=1 Tax=Mycolicibacterium brisbanense TaxID=146020 RepID=A0A100W1S2_9MYCO|nr:hypothetical protein [Mycolicibacterium brisbanense]GAS90007.1 Gp88 [Mycolicibacterium brisbanense]
MSAAPSVSGGVVPTRSQIEEWSTAHLADAATGWRAAATASEALFDEHRQNIASPGGSTWEGAAKDAALDRVSRDVSVVGNHGSVLREAADIAENGAGDITAAQRKAIEAITEAEDDGFRVGEDLSVRDTRRVDLANTQVRFTAASVHSENIRWNAEQLAAADALVGQRLQSKATELQELRFDDDGRSNGIVQAAKFKTGVDIDGDGKDDTEKLAEAFLYGQGQVRGSDGQLIPMTPERIMAALNLAYDTKYTVPENFLSNFNAAAVGGGNVDDATRKAWTKAIVKSAMDSGIPPEILAAQIDEETGGTWDPKLWTGFGEHPYYNSDGTRSNDDGRGLGQFTSGTWNNLMPDHPITNFDADASTPNLATVDPRTVPELALEAQGRYDRQVLGAIHADPRTASLGLSDTKLMLDGYNGGASYDGVLNAEANNPEYGGYASKILTEHVPKFQLNPSIPPPTLGTM